MQYFEIMLAVMMMVQIIVFVSLWSHQNAKQQNMKRTVDRLVDRLERLGHRCEERFNQQDGAVRTLGNQVRGTEENIRKEMLQEMVQMMKGFAGVPQACRRM